MLTNSIDPDQTARKEQSDQGLCCLLGHFNSNILGNYSSIIYVHVPEPANIQQLPEAINSMSFGRDSKMTIFQ